VLVYGDVDMMLVPKVLALTRHGNERVRAAAFATLAKVPPELVPDQALLRAADGDGDAESRRLATMALGYAGHPRAYFALLRIAATEDHPGSENACTLLVGLGDPATLKLLLETRRYAPDRDAFARLDAELRKRLAGLDLTDASLVRRWLERAAWLEVSGDPRAPRTAEAIVAALRQRIPAQHRERVVVQAQRAPKSSPYRGDEAAAMQAAIAALAARLRTAEAGR
jgi:hypothetical protein